MKKAGGRSGEGILDSFLLISNYFLNDDFIYFEASGIF